MGKLCVLVLVSLTLIAVLFTDSTLARRGYPPNPQNPPAGGYPNNPGGFPNQYPGGYPVRNAGQGYGQAGGYPGGGSPNRNPNNPILSPRYAGGGYGYGGGGYGMGGGYGYGGGGYGMGGGSPFSRSVHNAGLQPNMKSRGFAKKAMLAAGVEAVASMAVGYGLGRFPRPHFNFRNREEEHYYNYYMYRRYGSRSTDDNDFGRDYAYKLSPDAKYYVRYNNFMNSCMKRTDLLKAQESNTQIIPDNQGIQRISPEEGGDNNENLTDTATPVPNGQGGGGQEEDDTVSIEEIGYPALVEQLKARRCVELYMNYSERFLEKQTAERSSDIQPDNPTSAIPARPTMSTAVAKGVGLVSQLVWNIWGAFKKCVNANTMNR